MSRKRTQSSKLRAHGSKEFKRVIERADSQQAEQGLGELRAKELIAES